MLAMLLALGGMPPRSLCHQLTLDYPDAAEVALALQEPGAVERSCHSWLPRDLAELVPAKGRSSGAKGGVTAVHVVFPPLLLAKLFGGGGPSGELPPLSWTLLRQDSLHVEALLAAGADPNQVDEQGLTPLFYALDAARDGDERAIPLLLEAGADPALLPPLGAEGLRVAMRYPELEACPEEFWGEGEKALRSAAWELDGDSLLPLLSCEAAGPGRQGQALARVLDYGDWALAQEILELEPSLEAALREAARRNSWEQMPLLVELGADVNRERYERTLLSLASGGARPEAVEFLLEHGADPALRDPLLLTLDRWDAEPEHAQVALLLLQHGAPVTPGIELWADEHFGCGEVGKALVERGLEVTAPRLDGLMYMCPAEDFAHFAEQASSRTLRQVKRQNRGAPNAPGISEELRRRRGASRAEAPG